MRETLDTLSIGHLQLLQAKDGYRYSLDPVLLTFFASVQKGATVFDLGTGSGVLPLLLACRSEAREFVGIEIQTSLAERAVRNVELNGYQGRITILHHDIRDLKGTIAGGGADLVVSNPPYRHPGSGRVSTKEERTAARHEVFGGLVDFIAAASWLLRNGGRFAVIYLAERLSELLFEMTSAGLEPKRLRMVHPRQGKDARMVLVEGCKGGRSGLRVEEPLYVYAASGSGRNYSTEILQMYGSPSD
ncbi:tRNA1Val (adenine37-N6)-methyltransferase [Desulfuromusa kysingii]|uniref:tRNA1Val (Adenine37-N6)-methyltransferase n=1 Tax=Desulfuromusa kysingii TaxID=37625 RepID=A0A1H3ZK56_9BACT|nr:tRNA1(Val) (adenine(37)-N6)-methyltransferase [Desulfuromusa kysingii]SEA24037.1 tRNA1Val (adenine37-N6)-methyltransferase [Desulfuromusa kysingii]